MRLLVIGATGYLGAHVRRRALAAGMEVVTAGRSPLLDSPSHVSIDLAAADPLRLAGLVAEIAPNAVVNCAGAIAGPADVLADLNVSGTYALLRAMRFIPTARLVHLGSAAEYGQTEPGVPVTERTPPRPVGTYGVTKLAGTRLAELYRATGGDVIVLRVFNPVGPGAPAASLPGRLTAELRVALATGAAVHLGPLDSVRDFIDARDIADAVLAAVTASALPHPVLNIGSGHGVPVRALVKELVAISGYDGPVFEDSQGSARSAEVAWQQADIRVAREDLGWQPQRSLATSLADLWADR